MFESKFSSLKELSSFCQVKTVSELATLPSIGSLSNLESIYHKFDFWKVIEDVVDNPIR